MRIEQITTQRYRPGDAALIPVDEPDPFGFWLREIEANGQGLTSYYLGDLLIAVTFYMRLWDGVADASALINRQLAAGHGKQLAKAIRERILELMQTDGLHRVQATSEPADRASQVFLRAIGYHYESTMKMAAPDKGDLFLYRMLGD